MINKFSNIPLYSQLSTIIIGNIESGEYKEGSKIPSEQDFCEIHDISRPTVRQAINKLTQNGYLYKKKGKGTFVSSSSGRVRVDNYSGFVDSILESEEPGLHNILSTRVVSGPKLKRIESIFDMSTSIGDAEFAEIKYLIKKNEDVFSYNISYIPLGYFPDIISDILERKQSFDIMKDKYPLVPFRTKSALEVTYTDQIDAQHLQVHTGQALIKIENTLFSKSGQAVEHIITKYRADKCKLIFENTK